MPASYSIRKMCPSATHDTWWLHIVDGLRLVLRNSHNSASLETVKGLLLSGTYALFWLEVDEDYAGFAIMNLVADPVGLWANKVYVFADPRFPDLLDHCFPLLDAWAVDQGANYAHFFTARKGGARRAQRLGYTLRFQEFIKPIGRNA